MQPIGFIGLGLMGQPMARRLLDAGHPLIVWNRTAEKARRLLDAGAVWKTSPLAVAQEVDVVITMVTDSAASEEVVCGGRGVLEGAHPDLTLIDMSSITPEMSRSLATRAIARGVRMLDAPVTGGPPAAAEGRLGIMVGGPRETFEACLPIFQRMGVKVVYMLKDLSSALKLAEECGASLPAASISREMLQAAKAQGKGELDSSIVITVLEAMAGTIVGLNP
jgi:3-hydroxyisobutyrate dehydrogenase-like beta-hydroxyacid dehydrogenase